MRRGSGCGRPRPGNRPRRNGPPPKKPGKPNANSGGSRPGCCCGKRSGRSPAPPNRVEDFLRRLRDDGLLVTERLSPRDGTITGYAVAVQRPARDGTVEQVWFSGGKLAADLTLPKLRQRWPDPVPAAEQPDAAGRPG